MNLMTNGILKELDSSPRGLNNIHNEVVGGHINGVVSDDFSQTN